MSNGRTAAAGGVARLVERLHACDVTAPAELFDLVFDKVFAYAAACAPTPDDAGELAQDVLHCALDGLDGMPPIRDEADLLGWLFRIARTRCADLYPAGTSGGVPAAAARGGTSPDCLAAMRTLAEGARDVVVCLALLGYDVETTGRLLRMPPELVVVARRDATAALHASLGSSVA